MIILPFLHLATAYQTDDNFAFTDNVAGFLKTVDEFPDPVLANEIEGIVPDWIQGSFYRVGPGQYEYGTDKFNHVFDPSAIIKRIHIENGQVSFQRRFINSTHRAANFEENRIVFAEMGTWSDPPGAEDLSGEQLELERCKWLGESSPTDNTIVSVIPLMGWLVAFTESNLVNLIDPFTLETKHNLDLGESPNMPAGLTFATVLAHGVFDDEGNYWTMSVALDLPEHAFIPKSKYKKKEQRNLTSFSRICRHQIQKCEKLSFWLNGESIRNS